MMKKKLNTGDPVPDFCLPDQSNEEICLKNFNNAWIILYFYPKDNTPGCTIEALDFTAHFDDFQKQDAIVIGISPDSVKSHKNFCEKKNLKITLLSDTEKQVLQEFGVWKKKKMYGREYLGVERSTFVINQDRKIEKIWRKVKVKGHVEDVLKIITG